MEFKSSTIRVEGPIPPISGTAWLRRACASRNSAFRKSIHRTPPGNLEDTVRANIDLPIPVEPKMKQTPVNFRLDFTARASVVLGMTVLGAGTWDPSMSQCGSSWEGELITSCPPWDCDWSASNRYSRGSKAALGKDTRVDESTNSCSSVRERTRSPTSGSALFCSTR